MGIQVEVKEGGNFKPAPAGQFQAVCCEVVDLGHRQVTYKNDDGSDQPKNIHEIQYVFQLNKVDDETGKRFTIRSRPFNLILSEKSNCGRSCSRGVVTTSPRPSSSRRASMST
jgi:hypothetical protein